MTLDNSLTAQRAARTPDQQESRFRMTFATLLLAACMMFFLGLSWDIQWHSDVGPDSFFTAPHSLMYGGTALAGLLSLAVLVVTTVRYRRQHAGVTDGTTTPWLGVFRAPVGFIIAGLGSVGFIISGVYDLWWHTLYGFDVTLLSPPHFGILFSGPINMLGAIYAFASEANRARARGETVGLLHPANLGVACGSALIMAQFSMFLIITLDQIRLLGPIVAYAVVAAELFPLGLLAAASFLRRPGAATLTALIFTGLRYGIWFFSLWATGWLARYLGLPFQSEALPFAAVGFAMPTYLAVAGLAIDLALLITTRYHLGGRMRVWTAGILGGLAIFLLDPRWLEVVDAFPRTAERRAELLATYAAATAPSLAVVALVAALFAWLGWNIGVGLRYTHK